MSTCFPRPWYPIFRRRLLKWFDRHQRKLPWRETHDPYCIWISEIMLQQTQVATVVDYYHRFLKRFPTVESLAAARQDEVLQLWSGLGYYRRARCLQAAAQQIVVQGGRFPTCPSEIEKLSGVGRYTAGAIASFAFDLPAPILEANTIRLHSRVLGIAIPAKSSVAQKQLWNFAQEILPQKDGSGRINQAVMDLGSLVCTPRDPACNICPIRPQCTAHQQGLESKIPVLSAKPTITRITHVGAVILDRQGKILLRQNPPGQWWHGLWDLPWVEVAMPSVSQRLNATYREQAAELLSQNLDIGCELTESISTICHSVTKYKIHYHCYRARLTGKPRFKLSANNSLQWHCLDSLPPVSSRFKKFLLASQLPFDLGS